MSTKSLQYRIGMDIGDLRRKAAEAGQSTAAFRRELKELEQQQAAHRRSLDDMGRGMATFGAAVVAGLGVAAKAAIDWESAFAGVRKTVDGSDQEIAALEGELRQLARTLPSSHKEIAAVAEAAGQLGIKRDDVAEFTKTMIDLGETTNLTADEAATSLAKFSNIMGTSASDVDRLGSALVALGNDGASTEKDILDMALRIAGAGKQIGLTESQVLGLASALSSVGILAEGGGSSISTTMVKIASAVNEGGEAVEAFATVAGMSTDEFSKKFREDAAGAVIAFIQGLGRMQRTGQDVFGVLKALGLDTNEVRDTLLRASGASDMFAKSLQVGSKAWSENSALTDEANKRYATSAARMQVAWNQIQDALIDVGATVLPVVSGMVSGISQIVEAWRNLPGPVRDVVTWVGVAAGTIALFGGAALVAVPKVLAFRESMTALVASGGAVSGMLGKLGLAMVGPWGAAMAIGLTALTAFAIGQDEAKSATAEFTFEIDKQTKTLTRGGIEALHKHLSETHVKAGEAGKSTAYFRDVLKQTNLTVEDAIGWLLGEAEATAKVNEAFKAGAGNGPLLRQFMEDMRRDYEASIKQTQDATTVADKYADKQGNLADKTGDTAKKTDIFNKMLGETDTAADKAAKAVDDLIDQLDGLNEPFLNAREAQREWLDQLDNIKKDLKDQMEALDGNGKAWGERARTLDRHTEAGRKNEANLDRLAEVARNMAKAAAEEALRFGDANDAAAAMNASLLASRPVLIETAKSLGMGAKEASEYADKVLAIPQPDPTVFKTNAASTVRELQGVQDKIKGIPPSKQVNVGVLSEDAIRKLQEVGYKVERLPNGTVVISGNTLPLYSTLGAAISDLSRQTITIPVHANFSAAKLAKEIRESGRYSHGGIVSFAGGGMMGENHRPQIARARPGMVRVWAEAETDRESYIPWARDRRGPATAVLRATAAGFGYGLVPTSRPVQSFGTGGMTGASSGGWDGNVRLEVVGGTSELQRLIVNILQRYVRVNYAGNAQAAFGGRRT